VSDGGALRQVLSVAGGRPLNMGAVRMGKPDAWLRFWVGYFVVFITVMFTLLGLVLLLRWLGVLN
jgi:hypothetical protein